MRVRFAVMYTNVNYMKRNVKFICQIKAVVVIHQLHTANRTSARGLVTSYRRQQLQLGCLN